MFSAGVVAVGEGSAGERPSRPTAGPSASRSAAAGRRSALAFPRLRRSPRRCRARWRRSRGCGSLFSESAGTLTGSRVHSRAVVVDDAVGDGAPDRGEEEAGVAALVEGGDGDLATAEVAGQRLRRAFAFDREEHRRRRRFQRLPGTAGIVVEDDELLGGRPGGVAADQDAAAVAGDPRREPVRHRPPVGVAGGVDGGVVDLPAAAVGVAQEGQLRPRVGGFQRRPEGDLARAGDGRRRPRAAAAGSPRLRPAGRPAPPRSGTSPGRRSPAAAAARCRWRGARRARSRSRQHHGGGERQRRQRQTPAVGLDPGAPHLFSSLVSKESLVG